MIEVKTKDISFCGKRALNIVNTEAKREIMTFFTDRNIKINQRYANILRSSSLNYLSKQPHLISIKTAGTNHFLLLTYLNDTPTTIFIDRKIKSGYELPRILSSRLNFDESLYHKGTLFDGELVKDRDDNWMFLIYDMLVLDGKKLDWSITMKYNKMYTILDTQFEEDLELHNCPIRIKKLFPYSEYNKMITQYIPRLSYPIRGLYFNSLNKKHNNFLFLYPNQNTMHGGLMKEKTKKEKKFEGVVLKLRKTDKSGIYSLFTQNDEDYGIAHTTLSSIRMIRKIFEDNEDNHKNDDVLFQCIKNTNFDKWEIVKQVKSWS